MFGCACERVGLRCSGRPPSRKGIQDTAVREGVAAPVRNFTAADLRLSSARWDVRNDSRNQGAGRNQGMERAAMRTSLQERTSAAKICWWEGGEWGEELQRERAREKEREQERERQRQLAIMHRLKSAKSGVGEEHGGGARQGLNLYEAEAFRDRIARKKARQEGAGGREDGRKQEIGGHRVSHGPTKESDSGDPAQAYLSGVSPRSKIEKARGQRGPCVTLEEPFNKNQRVAIQLPQTADDQRRKRGRMQLDPAHAAARDRTWKITLRTYNSSISRSYQPMRLR